MCCHRFRSTCLFVHRPHFHDGDDAFCDGDASYFSYCGDVYDVCGGHVYDDAFPFGLQMRPASKGWYWPFSTRRQSCFEKPKQ